MFFISYPKAGYHVSFLSHPSLSDWLSHLIMIPTDLAYMKHFWVHLSWLWKWTPLECLCFKDRLSFTTERWSWLTRRSWKSSVCLSSPLIDAALQTVQDVQSLPDKDVLSATLVLDFIQASAMCPGATLKPLTRLKKEKMLLKRD